MLQRIGFRTGVRLPSPPPMKTPEAVRLQAFLYAFDHIFDHTAYHNDIFGCKVFSHRFYENVFDGKYR